MAFKIPFILLASLAIASAAGFDPVPFHSQKQNGSMQACVVDYNSCLSKACTARGGSPGLSENATDYTFTCSFNSSDPTPETMFYGGKRWGDTYECKNALGECILAKNPGIVTKICAPPSFVLALLMAAAFLIRR